MASTQFSSGDVIVDRRADYARMLAESGDHLAATELMAQALELAPNWPAGWFKLGEYQEKSGDKGGAISAYEMVVSLDPEGIFAASLKLAVLGAAEVPDQPPSRYVEELFDEYAVRFETALVEKLEYSVPAKLTALIEKNIPTPSFRCVVDIGCGTGLLGVEIKSMAGRLEGFDISANMLSKAEEKEIYDYLGQADLALGPEESALFSESFVQHRADLVAAADVLMYLGSLATVFDLDAGDKTGFTLRPSLRYAHSFDYVCDLLAKKGFDLLESVRTTIRMDAGKPITGILFIARKAD
jgi:predicted TPR repeat methyltransferase